MVARRNEKYRGEISMASNIWRAIGWRRISGARRHAAKKSAASARHINIAHKHAA